VRGRMQLVGTGAMEVVAVVTIPLGARGEVLAYQRLAGRYLYLKGVKS